LLTAFASDGTQKWSQSVSTSSPPAVGVDGTIYIATTSHILHAWRPDGTEAWSAPAPSAPGAAPPLLGQDGVIYLVDKEVYAFGADGTVLGTRDIGSSAAAPAALVGSTVYFVDADNHVRAMGAR
jgi:outer membrane protein assembly factor BamB